MNSLEAHPLVPAPPAGNLRRGQRCPSGPSATGLFPVGGPGPDCNQENWPWMCFSGDFFKDCTMVNHYLTILNHHLSILFTFPSICSKSKRPRVV